VGVLSFGIGVFDREAETYLMKRIAVLVLAVLSLAACGGSSDDEQVGGGEATTPKAGEGLRVGLVTDVGQLNDRGFNQLAFQGLQRAERELGVEIRVLESASDAEYIPNHSSLAEQGYDIVIGVGFAQGEAVAKVAQQFPDTKFVIIDVDQASLPGKPANVVGLLFKEEEVGYLAGYLAALTAKRDGEDTISSVGGMKEPPVDRFIAGYQAGAKAAEPGITTLNGYSQDWDDLAKCKEVALDQISRGSNVVFQVAGGCGLGALDAAKEQSVWGVGVDNDQKFLGRHILTSAVKRVDVAVEAAVISARRGGFQGGTDALFNLKNDGVAIGKIDSRVPKAFIAKMNALRPLIISGRIKPPTKL
jgi:basic membrane protein A and related proteins